MNAHTDTMTATSTSTLAGLGWRLAALLGLALGWFLLAAPASGAELDLQPGDLLVAVHDEVSGLNELQEVDTEAGRVRDVLTVPDRFLVRSIVVSSEGVLFLAVDDSTSGATALVALSASGTVLAEQPAAHSPSCPQMALDPLDATQRTVLVADPVTATVNAVNPFAATTTLRISGVEASGLATDAEGTIYVSDGSSILRYAADGSFQGRVTSVEFGEAFGAVESGGITVDSTGHVYLAVGPALAKFAPDGELDSLLGEGLFSLAAQVVFSPGSSLLWVTDRRANTLSALTTTGVEVSTVALPVESETMTLALVPCRLAGTGRSSALVALTDAREYSRLGSSAAVGSRGEDLVTVLGAPGDPDLGPLAGSALVVMAEQGDWSRLTATELTGIGTEQRDEFGGAVAMSGSTVVVGAATADGLGNGEPLAASGAVHVFPDPLLDAQWRIVLYANDGREGDRFGAAVAVSGGTLVVGAPGAADGAGAAYVFGDAGADGSWGSHSEVKLAAEDGTAGDAFGFAVAASGSTLVVGAPLADQGDGAVYIFQDATGMGAWRQVNRLSAASSRGHFGASLAISGGQLVVGSFADNSASGSAHLFRDASAAGDWSSATVVELSPSSDADAFGSAVAIDGSRVVVGAFGADSTCSDAGAVYVFHDTTGDWSNVTETVIVPAGTAAGDRFGRAVAVLGGVVVASSPRADESGVDAGSAQVFDLVGQSFDQPAPRHSGSGSRRP